MINNNIFIDDIINFMEWGKEFWYNKSENFKKAYDSNLYKDIKNNNLDNITPDILINFIKNDIKCTPYHLLSKKNSILYFIEINKENFYEDKEFKLLYKNNTYDKIINNKKVSDKEIDKLYNMIGKYCSSNILNDKLKDPMILVIAS